MAEKARHWCAILYPENMIEHWEDEIGHILQMPSCYGIHDGDMEEDGVTPRKPHVHLVLPFSGPVTQGNVIKIANTLSKPGMQCCSTAKAINNMRYMYNYLIHDTDDARKKHKKQYDKSHRVCLNGFDIGFYEQISLQDKINMTRQLCDTIIKENHTNFADFYVYVVNNFDSTYFEILESKSGLFERLTKSLYQKKFNKQYREK